MAKLTDKERAARVEAAAQVEAVTLETKLTEILGNWDAKEKLLALRDDAHYARLATSVEQSTKTNQSIEERNNALTDTDARYEARHIEWQQASLEWQKAALAFHAHDEERLELARREVAALETIAKLAVAVLNSKEGI